MSLRFAQRIGTSRQGANRRAILLRLVELVFPSCLYVGPGASVYVPPSRFGFAGGERFVIVSSVATPSAVRFLGDDGGSPATWPARMRAPSLAGRSQLRDRFVPLV